MQTNEWLEQDFDAPYKICETLLPSFEKGTNVKELYEYLSRFGMYKPCKGSRDGLRWLKTQHIWKRVERLHQKYQERWRGPDVEIFIFPTNGRKLFGNNNGENKSGVSFPDKLFLFLSHLQDSKELEALFVHDYHHICRIRAQKKDIETYTLLDSIILEGTAEYSVEKICGKKYRANWCNFYGTQEIEKYWQSFIRENLVIKKNDRVHDAILFGGNRFPKLIGYGAGYHLVKKYYNDYTYSEKSSLFLPPEIFLEKS